MAGPNASTTVWRGRRFAVSALLGTSAAYTAALAWSAGAPASSTALATGAVLAASVAASRKALLPQVASRAVTWLFFGPSAVAVLASLASGRPLLEPIPYAIAGGVALLAGAPLLHTREAHDPFAPVRFRRTWIAGATAAITGAIVTGALAVFAAWWGELAAAAGIAALAIGLAASARSVLAMRGSGVLLGGATAVGAVVAALATGFAPLLLAALPGLLLVSPLALSRLLPESSPPSPEAPRLRIASPVRIAPTPDPDATEEDLALEAPPLARRTTP